MMSPRHMALVGAMALLVGGCAAAAETPTSTTAPPVPTTLPAPPTTTPTTVTTTAPESPGSAVDWDDPSVVVDLGGGWTIHACEGDGPFLCVDRDGTGVGALEAATYPVDSFDAFDPTADPDTNLATFASLFHETFATDRAEGCGADYRYQTLGPEPFALGGAPGIFYGFSGALADGSASELNLQYATIVGDTIVSVTAIAYDEGGCPGRDDTSTWDSATLGEFWPLLEEVLAAAPLPSR